MNGTKRKPKIKTCHIHGPATVTEHDTCPACDASHEARYQDRANRSAASFRLGCEWAQVAA